MFNQKLFFLLNGAGTLILETAWLKKHISIFGSSPESYGSVLFAYFLGVSAGSWYFSRNDVSPKNLYLGFSIALIFSLCLPVFLLDGVRFPAEFVYGQPFLYKALIWALAIISIFPTCFFLGGFFPLVAQTVNRKSFVLLYGIQALGTVLGIYLGSFFLPYAVGYLITFMIGIAINAISLFFLHLSFRDREAQAGALADTSHSLRFGAFSFFSGFLSLVLQVLWIRFIALATDNSIYAFGSASLIILLQLTVSSYLTSKLPESWFRNSGVFTGILFFSLIGMIASTEIYLWMTDGLAIRAVRDATGLFGSLSFAASFIVIGYFFISFIFPFILRMAKSGNAARDSGSLGSLIAMNGLGCALGSILTSFVFLPKLGIWTSLLIALIGYVLLLSFSGKTRTCYAAVVLGCALIFIFSPLSHPLVTPVDPVDTGSRGSLVSAKEGKYGIVSVIDYRNRRTLWLNNTYQLEAGLNDVRGPYRMGLLPTVLHPDAKTLAMIGIGTGISSNGFLNSHLNRITLVEMIPEVADAAAKHFQAYNGNVLANPRVETIIDDGRHYFRTGNRPFDIICSDVFTPWNEGTAYLYTVDHFKNVKKRLNPGGLFSLWLPMFQMTREEFLIIAKSFASVFPHATVWQLSWGLEDSGVALIGTEKIQTEAIKAYKERLPFPETTPDLMQIHESGIFASYIGPIIPGQELWQQVPLNTLDFPIIEFKAAQKGRNLLRGKELLDLFNVFFALPGNPSQEYFTLYDKRLEEFRMAGWHLNLSSFFAGTGDYDSARHFSAKAASLPAFVAYKKVLADRKQ